MCSVNIRLDRLETTTTTAFFPCDARVSRAAFPRTIVSERFEYILLESITAGILLSGLSNCKATTEPVSIGNPS